jgi:hypothetical protein
MPSLTASGGPSDLAASALLANLNSGLQSGLDLTRFPHPPGQLSSAAAAAAAAASGVLFPYLMSGNRTLHHHWLQSIKGAFYKDIPYL